MAVEETENEEKEEMERNKNGITGVGILNS
jgi:hypothetical protein